MYRRCLLVGTLTICCVGCGTESTEPNAETDPKVVEQKPNCRRFTASAKLSGDLAGTATASFDTKTNVYSLMIKSPEGEMVANQHYASLADFVAEAKAFGRTLITKDVEEEGGKQRTTTFTYDAKQRLTQKTRAEEKESRTAVFTAWDDKGRPTAGTKSADYGCKGAPITIIYDDVARTRKETIEDAKGVGCGDRLRVGTETYDENGNVILVDNDDGNGDGSKFTITVEKVIRVCTP